MQVQSQQRLHLLRHSLWKASSGEVKFWKVRAPPTMALDAPDMVNPQSRQLAVKIGR